ncbi:MAG TPA: hypothetical protein VFD59_01380 [Nocardioidaceae bacterium]|nr:hypothetical protein [Nocardioidaceae bacterium]
MLGVDEVEVRDVVDEPAVGLLGGVLVEAAVARLHVIDGDPYSFRDDARDRTVGVTEDQDGVGALLQENFLGLDEDLTEQATQAGRAHVQEVVGFPDAKLVEEDAVELVAVVLPCMEQHVLDRLVEPSHDPGQPNDLRPGADDSHYLDHASTFIERPPALARAPRNRVARGG